MKPPGWAVPNALGVAWADPNAGDEEAPNPPPPKVEPPAGVTEPPNPEDGAPKPPPEDGAPKPPA